MSSYMVIAGVSEALRRVLWEQLRADPEVGQLFPSQQDIVFKNPTETARSTANRLSLWLYQITENEFVKNAPMIKAKNSDRKKYPPMAINLNFLVTPFANLANGDNTARDEDHMVLGKVMQVLYDNSIIFLRDPNTDIAEELRIIFKHVSLEELTRIWEALREPYRLSVCYEIRVTRIDSTRINPAAPIVERNSGRAPQPEQDTAG